MTEEYNNWTIEKNEWDYYVATRNDQSDEYLFTAKKLEQLKGEIDDYEDERIHDWCVNTYNATSTPRKESDCLEPYEYWLETNLHHKHHLLNEYRKREEANKDYKFTWISLVAMFVAGFIFHNLIRNIIELWVSY